MPRRRAPWWMFVVAASFLAYFALLFYSDFWGPEPLGLMANFSGGRMAVTEVVPGSPAERAGIQRGDHVISGGGPPIRNFFDWIVIRVNEEPDRPFHLEIDRAGARRQVVLVLHRLGWREREAKSWVSAFGLYTARLVALMVALVIAFRRPQDLVARIGAWFLAATGVLYTVLPPSFAPNWRHLPSPVDWLLWIPLFSCTAGFAPLFFTFFAIFPRKLFHARWAWVLVWAPALIVWWPLSGFGYRMLYQPERATGFLPDWARLGLSVGGPAYVLAGLAALVLNYQRLADKNERRRVSLIVLGSAVGFLPSIPFVLLLWLGPPSRFSASAFMTYSAILNILLAAFPLSFAYAILRHRLFDIRVMIRLGLQYALTRRLLLSVVPVLATILLADLVVHGDQPLVAILRSRAWVYLVLGGLAIMAHTQRQRWLGALDRRFFRERYDAHRLLRTVVEEVCRARSFEPAAPRVVAQIEAALHPEFAALLVRKPKEPNYLSLAAAPAGQAPPPLSGMSKLVSVARVLGAPLEVPRTESDWLSQQLSQEEADYLRQTGIDLLVPIAVAPDQPEALLALGPKRSEEPYSGEDRDLLVAVATSLALLLEKPTAPPSRVSETFEECQKCGACYEAGSGRCVEDGATLTPTYLPWLLADRYRLERRLGRGGMGTVYAATDTALDRRVAAKVMRDDLAGNAQAAERFHREARATAGFAHPHVVRVYDFGLVAGMRAFLVMELLDGVTLREELCRVKHFAPVRVVEILHGVCAAVDAAHRRALIHRDLKPENIFLVCEGTSQLAKVLDFGVAKLLPSDPQATKETDPGALTGTLAYMGPEQFRGNPVDMSWDIWALAVVAYEMLTGAHPFPQAKFIEFQSAVLAGRFTPLRAHVPDAPSRWQEFFERALAPDPDRRPASAGGFISELQSAIA